ncbi:ATP-binding protein [Ferrimicrobium sp.]|uniref:ATP-binding protein n=1 Tax=Ferrimicrobium sp. TaxID=2926050 RepID=UPI0026117DEB|nr:ATP-binding protein [Ferrimicrobium sp.]
MSPSADLVAQLALIKRRIRVLLDARRDSGIDLTDVLRGLYLSDEDVDRALQDVSSGKLERIEPELAAILPGGERLDVLARTRYRGLSPLDSLMKRFGLDMIDVFLLVVAAAPDLDRRFERLYAFLNDDVTCRRVSVGVALELCGSSDSDGELRQHLRPGSVLLASGLLQLGSQEDPFLHREVRVNDEVVDFLLGGVALDLRPELEVAQDLRALSPAVLDEEVTALTDLMCRGSGLVYLLSPPGSTARVLGVAAFDRVGVGTLVVDAGTIKATEDLDEQMDQLLLGARLMGAGLLVGPIESLFADGSRSLRRLVDADHPVIVYGQAPWDAHWSRRLPHICEVSPLGRSGRERLLGSFITRPLEAGLLAAFVDALDPFNLGPEQLFDAWRFASGIARAKDRFVQPDDVVVGARLQGGTGLARLAQRIHPVATWDDLIVSRPIEDRLHMIARRVRHRGLLAQKWGIRPSSGRGTGVVVLFFGESGTGKTLSAEVIANELGLDLFTINLATVVDKYVGETEKNLEAIFHEAIGMNGVLFFDEADALFGKRSEGGDAHDRYANIEVAYLLQRIETFDGLAILATNLRANMDPAFIRRIDVVVDFSVPSPRERRLIWEHYLPPAVPRASDVDLGFMAHSFRLAGGAIRNICIGACFEASECDTEVSMAEIIRATQRELEKLGRLCVAADFGPYFDLIDSPHVEE